MPRFHFVVASLPVLFAAIAPAQIPEGAVKLAALHEAWGPKANSPNASLEIRQSGHSGDKLQFRLYAKGLPKDQSYSLLNWPITQKAPTTVGKGISLDASGLAVCSGKPGACGNAKKPNEPINLALQPLPGEPVRLGLVAADGKMKAFGTSVPIPLRGEDRGCVLDAVMLTPGAELLRMEGSGLSPNSEVQMDSDSDGERRNTKGRTGPDGKYLFLVMPLKPGISQGSIRLRLTASKCSPSVTVPWGQHALH